MTNAVAKEDARFPALLRDIAGCPNELYYRGVWDDSLFELCLAVVGARRMTTYGKRVTEQLVGEVAAAGVTIVSGFMYGIDAAAHKAALRARGRTIAVMPCGIDRIHPEYQEDLYHEVLDSGGLVISEWAGDMQPAHWTYPMRNRIVAGLCFGTLVVEAGEKSGSLITARLAQKFERKLFAVPGPITSSVSQGTLQLLKQGAIMVTGANDILDLYGRSKPDFEHVKSGLSGIEGDILEKLQAEPLQIDELSRNMQTSAAELGTVLSLMQLNGLVHEEGGRYYVTNKN